MSNFLTIATVTETIKQRLNAVVEADIAGATATAVRPYSVASDLPQTGVNIYLYRVSPNSALCNADLPTRRIDGTVSQIPRVALDLHYLLSFYGNEAELAPQRVLGSVVRALHAQPVLTHKMIQDAISAATANLPFLSGSDLAGEVELVKFTPISLSLEELSKLWSIFFQTPYNLSVAYQASVVLIDGKETPMAALPVRERRIHVMPFRQPKIENVSPQFINSDGNLVLEGQNLRGDIVSVRFGSVSVPLDTGKGTDNEIAISLPAGLRAGINTVQVIHDLDFGTPRELHRGFESNVAVFMLRPKIAVSIASVSTEVENEIEVKKGKIKIDFTPVVEKSQRVIMFLNRFNPPSDSSAQVFSFKAPSDTGITDPDTHETASIEIPFKIKKEFEGAYLVRVQVDGAESELDIDSTTGIYNSPQVTI